MPHITLNVSTEIHARLTKLKRKGESFNDVLARELPEPCVTGREILDWLEKEYPPKRKTRRAA